MFKKSCLHCGKEFRPLIGTQMYCCRSCYELAKKKKTLGLNAEEQAVYNRKKRDERAARNKRTLDDTLKELDKYNAEHGTILSYGQFVVMRDRA